MGRRFPPENQEPRGPNTDLPAPGKGLAGIQLFRKLRRQHPGLENHEVWALAGYGNQERGTEAANAPWADGRASPSEARWRGPDPRKGND